MPYHVPGITLTLPLARRMGPLTPILYRIKASLEVCFTHSLAILQE